MREAQLYSLMRIYQIKLVKKIVKKGKWSFFHENFYFFIDENLRRRMFYF